MIVTGWTHCFEFHHYFGTTCWVAGSLVRNLHQFSLWVFFEQVEGGATKFTWKMAIVCSWLGRLFDRVDLINPVSNVRPSLHTYVRAYIHPQKGHPILIKFSMQVEVDEWCTMVWPDSRSRSRSLQSWKSGRF